MIEIFNYKNDKELKLPLAQGIRAGFPSPAQDYTQTGVDLNQELIKHPASTFYGRVTGKSMIDAGIDEGDILVIDKSLQPCNGDMAVCFIDGEFTLKYIEIVSPTEINLVPANKDFPIIKVTPDNNFIVWGIVTYTIKKRR